MPIRTVRVQRGGCRGRARGEPVEHPVSGRTHSLARFIHSANSRVHGVFGDTGEQGRCLCGSRMSSRFGGICDRGSRWSRCSVLRTGPRGAPRMTRNPSLGTVRRDEESAPRSARGEGESTEACRGHEALEQLEPRLGLRGGRGPGCRVAGGGVSRASGALRGPLGWAWPPCWVTKTAGAFRAEEGRSQTCPWRTDSGARLEGGEPEGVGRRGRRACARACAGRARAQGSAELWPGGWWVVRPSLGPRTASSRRLGERCCPCQVQGACGTQRSVAALGFGYWEVAGLEARV